MREQRLMSQVAYAAPLILKIVNSSQTFFKKTLQYFSVFFVILPLPQPPKQKNRNRELEPFVFAKQKHVQQNQKGNKLTATGKNPRQHICAGIVNLEKHAFQTIQKQYMFIICLACALCKIFHSEKEKEASFKKKIMAYSFSSQQMWPTCATHVQPTFQ